jgi:hypothetical protein
MKILFLLFAIGVVTSSIFAQGTSKITVNSHNELSENNIFSCELYFRDSLVQKREFNGNIDFVDLLPGIYNFIVFENNTKVISVHNIEAVADSITVVFFQNPSFSLISVEDTLDEGDVFLVLGFQYGLPGTSVNNFILNSYEYSFGFAFYASSKRFYNVGFYSGLGYNYAPFEKDTSMYLPTSGKKEFYSYLSYQFGFLNRFSFFDTEKKNRGLTADLGLLYNLPIFFRHIYHEEADQQLISRKIHKFNDFRAMASVGYAPLCIRVEYRLTNFVKKDFPELPKLTIGLMLEF